MKKIMRHINKIFLLLCAGALFSCSKLDIPPVNIVGENEIFGSKEGMTAYIARMYSTLPMEDFKYYIANSGLFNYSGTMYKQQSCLTGEAIGRDTQGAEGEKGSYWDGPYSCIRIACKLLETLPDYKKNFTESDYNTWMGEAYFYRAFLYYSLVKRYGGVPKVDKVIDYPAKVDYEGTKMPRASEEAIWDFIGNDLDKAYDLLPETNQKGRANKSVAAAFKSRVMLHAGSIAKYNTVDEKDGDVRICGIPSSRAKDYFKAAYDASLKVDSGKYSLYKGMWKAGDHNAIATNFGAIFVTETNETIFARYYDAQNAAHAFDDSAQPHQTSTGNNNSELNPTLDFVEMFDGIEKDANGHLKCFDDNGHYRVFSTPYEIFKDCEPRLEGTVILPHSTFKDQVIDLHYGVWAATTSVTTMGPLLTEEENFSMNYTSKYGNEQAPLVTTGRDITYTFPDGTKMSICGKSGVYNAWNFGGISGFYQRKYLNPTAGSNNTGSVSKQPWIELRYAEVLLNRAEAAMELISLGETGTYKSEAFKCIKDIRERAGATPLASENDLTIDVVRKERRKELAFEHKAYWDLIRWRVLHIEQNNTKYRTLSQFYSLPDKKWFLDPKYQETRGGFSYIYTFNQRSYYQQIPTAEITRNPNCKQNPGY